MAGTEIVAVNSAAGTPRVTFLGVRVRLFSCPL